MIVPRHYENVNVLHENTMPPRAYYIPASLRMDTLVEKREDSDRFQLLNGDWRFSFYASIYELKDAFYETDFDISSFDCIKVPGTWQMAGYDTHQYTNIRYPFPFDPHLTALCTPGQSLRSLHKGFRLPERRKRTDSFPQLRGRRFLLLRMAQRNLHRLQPGIPQHKRI